MKNSVSTLLIGWLLLLTACSTTRGPGGATRDYSETQLSRNVFAVGTREKSSRATELCLLRCAEITLAQGFKYFVVIEVGVGRSPATGEGTRSSFLDSSVVAPSSANTIACFRKQPAGYPAAFDAEVVIARLAPRYGLGTRPAAPANPGSAAPLQFDLYPSFLLLPRTSPNQIVFLEPGARQRTIVIGVLNDWENPCASLKEFKRKAADAAAILGGQAVQIRSQTGAAQSGGAGYFSATLLLLPKARLGILDEGGPWPRTELVVRGFEKESLAPGAGLKVGDRVVALNGIDVFQEKRFADVWLSWSVGESVVVTFVRDGVKMSLQAKTVAN